MRSVLKLSFYTGGLLAYVSNKNVVMATTCLENATTVLSTKMEASREAMMTAYDEECGMTCAISQSPLQIETDRDYDQIRNLQPQLYDRYVSECASLGFSMCTVDSEVTISMAGIVGSPSLSQVVREYNKPLCYPSGCLIDQVDLLNPYDRSCQGADLAGQVCEKNSISVKCPEERVEPDTPYDCVASMPSRFSPMNIAKQGVYSLMDGSCATATAPEGLNVNNRFCEVITTDATITERKDFTAFGASSPLYEQFGETCFANNGVHCDVSYTLFLASPVGGLNYDIENVNYPICLPADCVEDTTKAAKDILLFEITGGNELINVCEIGNCDLEISELTCYEKIVIVGEDVSETLDEPAEDSTETSVDKEDNSDETTEKETTETAVITSTPEEEASSSHHPSSPLFFLITFVLAFLNA